MLGSFASSSRVAVFATCEGLAAARGHQYQLITRSVA